MGLSNNTVLCIIYANRVSNLDRLVGICEEEALRIAKHVNCVHVVRFYKKFTARRISNNVVLHFFPFKDLDDLSLVSFAFSMLLQFVFLAHLVMLKGVSLLRANDPIFTGFPAIIIGKILRKPVVVFIGGNPILNFKRKFGDSTPTSLLRIWTGLAKILSNFTIRNGDWVLTIDEKHASFARKMGAKGVTIIGLLLDLMSFRPSEFKGKENGSTKVLCAGRLEAEKGIEYLLYATKLVVDNGGEVKLMIAGEGSCEGFLKRTAKSLNIAEFVTFLGPVPHDEMPKIINTADMVVLPSLTEGLPLTILEAFACGKPVIASKVGSVPRLINDKKNGILVRPKDVQALANSIDLLIKDKNLRRRIGQAGREFVLTRFSDFADLRIKKQLSVYSRLTHLSTLHYQKRKEVTERELHRRVPQRNACM